VEDWRAHASTVTARRGFQSDGHPQGAAHHFREPQRGYRWIKAGNEAFAGRSALDIMLGGELTDLMRVRRYLDAERGAQ
jgi:hypothetical protein